MMKNQYFTGVKGIYSYCFCTLGVILLNIAHGIFQGTALTILTQITVLGSFLLLIRAISIIVSPQCIIRIRIITLLLLCALISSFGIFHSLCIWRFSLSRKDFEKNVLELRMETIAQQKPVAPKWKTIGSMLRARERIIEKENFRVFLFETGSGFPNKKFGYAYIEGDASKSIRMLEQSFARIYPIDQHWFFFSG